METFSRLLILAFLPFIFTGCVTTGHVFSFGDELPTGRVCQIVTTWQNQVIFSPDTMHGGASTPGIAGRLYLFDQGGLPVVGDGGVTIELYNDSAVAKGGEAKLLELWKLDKEILRCALQRDTIGWGYTLLLPWGTYSPAITAVHMKVRYEPPKGLPLYSEGGTVTLNKQGNASVRTEARTIAPSTEKKEAVAKR
jgi:hypothetical protein